MNTLTETESKQIPQVPGISLAETTQLMQLAHERRLANLTAAFTNRGYIVGTDGQGGHTLARWKNPRVFKTLSELEAHAVELGVIAAR